MAKIKRQVKTIDKWKKKKWFTLIAPKLFQERPLGQTCASSSDLLKGRTITTNLMNLTGNMRRQNVNIQFEADGLQGENVLTHVKKIELVPTFIKRKVRRNRDRIDSSFVCKTKDNKYIRIKPMLITVSKSSRATQAQIKKKLVEYIAKIVSQQSYDDLIRDIVNFKLQRNIKYTLSPIFPILDVEIRSTILLKGDALKLNKKVVEGKVEEKTEPAKEAKKEEPTTEEKEVKKE